MNSSTNVNFRQTVGIRFYESNESVIRIEIFLKSTDVYMILLLKH